MHKTATTSFQYFLSKNSGLLANFGCLYPTSMRFKDQHSLLPGCFIPNHTFLPKDRCLDPEIYLKELKNEMHARQYKFCVISSEVFHELMIREQNKAKEIIKRIGSFADDYKILVTTRNNLDAAFSGLKHRLRSMNLVKGSKLFKNQNLVDTFSQMLTSKRENLLLWKNSGLPIIERSMDEASNPALHYFDVVLEKYDRSTKIEIINQIGTSNTTRIGGDLRVNKDNSPAYKYLILILSSLIMSKINGNLYCQISFNRLSSFVMEFNSEEIPNLLTIKNNSVLRFLQLSCDINSKSQSTNELLINAGIGAKLASLVINISSSYIEYESKTPLN